MKRQEGKTGEFLRRRNLKGRVMSRSLKVDFVHFYFLSFIFIFLFSFFFYSLFLFLEQLRLGVISHAVTSATS